MIQAIIQARLGGSTRYGKQKIFDKIEYKTNKGIVKKITILDLMIKRLKKSKYIDKITIAIPYNEIDLFKFCKKKCYNVSIGSENNVLDRFINASEGNNIIRLTADCPLICSDIIDELIIKHISEDNDFTTNSFLGKETYPDGFDCSIIKRKILFDLRYKNLNYKHKEHVVTYIMENEDKYKIGILNCNKDYSNIRITIDYPEDLKVIQEVVDKLGINFSEQELYNLFEKEKEIFELNKKYSRNSSYYEQKGN